MTQSTKFCCFCDEQTNSNDKNIFTDTTNHTNIVFYKIIEEFLDNPIENITDNNFIGCSKCISKINKYDLAAVTFKSVQKEMLKIIRLCESKFQSLMGEYKIYLPDDVNVVVDCNIKLENGIIPAENDSLIEPEILNQSMDEDNLDSLKYLSDEDENAANKINNKTNNKYNKNLSVSTNEIIKSYTKKSKYGKNFCIPCNMNLTTRKDYTTHCKTKRHKSIVNGTVPYNCEDCGKKLLTETGLKDHITYFHTTERKYLCTICNKYFATGNLLCYHRNREHPDAFRCPICQKRLISSYLTIEEHINYVHNNKPVECIECNIKYKNLHSLYQHRKAVHVNMRLYQCELCGKKFNENNALRNHIKYTHDKIKNFACDLCNFKTTTKSVLVRHHRIHTGEKKYNCEICGKNYVAKYNLERHIKTLHSDSMVKERSNFPGEEGTCIKSSN